METTDKKYQLNKIRNRKAELKTQLRVYQFLLVQAEAEGRWQEWNWVSEKKKVLDQEMTDLDYERFKLKDSK
jgi:hypothetical protein